MTSTIDKIRKIRDALTGIETAAKIYHYRKPTDDQTDRYIVWQEDGGQYFSANNRGSELSITGTVDLYTKQEYDQLVDQIPKALNDSAHASIELNAVDYDDETNLIHYEWTFSVA